MSLQSKDGKLLASNGHLCNTCCSRYKCNTLTHVCSKTDEPLENPNVYASLAECMTHCSEPCATPGCDFTIQFYYLQDWGGHQCDLAVFDAYCGGRLLGEVDLNNGVDGGSRFSAWFNVFVSDFIPATCSYSFSLICKLSGCHQGIAGLKFSTGLDLPAMSGDAWGVSANDICLPHTGLSPRRTNAGISPRIMPEEIHARLVICRECAQSAEDGFRCVLYKAPPNCPGGCFGAWRRLSASKCPLGKWPEIK